MLLGLYYTVNSSDSGFKDRQDPQQCLKCLKLKQ